LADVGEGPWGFDVDVNLLVRTLFRLFWDLILELRDVSGTAFDIINPTTVSPTISSPSTNTYKPPIGAIVGGAIAGVTVIVIAMIMTLWFCKRYSKKAQSPGVTDDTLEPYTYTPSFTLPQPQVSVAGKQIRAPIYAAWGESSSSVAAGCPQMSQTEPTTTSQGRSHGPSQISRTNIEEIAQALHRRMQAQQCHGDSELAPPEYEKWCIQSAYYLQFLCLTL
jgi:hypothetical protein